jgi:tRNA-(ms[2]io[6]A)-hydroxylase
MRRLVAKSEPQREVDLMICGAFIEARSCERFASLAEALVSPLGAPLRQLFLSLHNAEARHYKEYVDLARRAAARPGAAGALLPFDARVDQFAALEATLITSPDAVFRFHSGPPGEGSGPPDGPDADRPDRPDRPGRPG